MSKNALTPFERRLEHWELTHVRHTIAKTGNKIAEAISKNTKRKIEVANRFIVSQERISQGIEEISVGIDRLSDGLESLRAAFDWGFSEIVWQLEQERELLLNIKKILEAPLDNQAKELRKRAEEAYKNGWIEDALDDFLESEKKNRYDFIVHQYLGNIYFFEKKNPKKALSYYEKALKYSTPKSPYHGSIALLHIGLINYLQKDFQKACEATSEAIKLFPNLLEAYYQRAQYSAVQGKYNDAIENLRIAIGGDRYYCVKADTEEDFDVMKDKLIELFEELRDNAKNLAQQEIDNARIYIQDAKLWDADKYTFDSGKYSSAKEKLNEVKSFFERNSYFDYLDAISIANSTQKAALDSLLESLSKQISDVEREYREESKRDKDKKQSISRVGFWICTTIFITAWIMLKSFSYAFVISTILYFSIFIYSKTPFKHRESYEEDITNLENKSSESQKILNQMGQEKTRERDDYN